jgi:tRNA pseudouridine38-40 synthase
MKRYFLKIEYNGSNFSGWQVQKNKRTVQGEFENALEKVFHEKVEVCASGRTDAKVHALDQAVHFDLNADVPLEKLVIALNDMLPEDIAVKKAKVVKSDFNSRYDIKKKTYLYMLKCGYDKSAIDGDKITHIKPMLCLEKMQEIIPLFLGKHDFSGYCSAHAQVKDFEREIYSIKISQKKDMFSFRITGNGFLYNMVRILVGSFVDYSLGKRSKEDLVKALKDGKRELSGRTMPPNGLYLEKTYY